MTNLEEIKTWSADKMAWWLEDMYICCICAYQDSEKCSTFCGTEAKEECRRGIAEWLNSEYNGEV